METLGNKIKGILRQRAKDRKKISITINSEHFIELNRLAKLHGVPLSTIIEVCIELGLADSYINPENPDKLKEDDFD